MPSEEGAVRSGPSGVGEVSPEAAAPDDPRVIAAVPEPATLTPLGLRVGGLLVWRRRRRAA